jgi:hypothetical protein
VDKLVTHESTQEGRAESAQETPAELREGNHDGGVYTFVPKVYIG